MAAAQDQQRPSIRRMRLDDREFIISLVPRLEEVGMPPWRDAEKMHAFHQHYGDETANASGLDQAVFIAESAGERLGVVHVLEATSGLTGERQGYVATLAVSERGEGRGIGRALMTEAEAWCRERGLNLIALDVFAQNIGARAFYARLGYVEETLKMIKSV